MTSRVLGVIFRPFKRFNTLNWKGFELLGEKRKSERTFKKSCSFIKDLFSRLILGNRSKLPNMSTDFKSPWVAGFLGGDFSRTPSYPGKTQKMTPTSEGNMCLF